jgi:hypothetical protein
MLLPFGQQTSRAGNALSTSDTGACLRLSPAFGFALVFRPRSDERFVQFDRHVLSRCSSSDRATPRAVNASRQLFSVHDR